MRAKRFSNSRGFSLIELIIVFVIMGFILAFAGPRVAKSLLGLTIKTTAKKIAGSLRYARSKAVNTGRVYSVIFDTEKNRVIVFCSGTQDASAMAGEDNDTSEEEASGDEDFTDQPQQKGRELKIFPIPDEITLSKITVADIVSTEEDSEGGIYQMAFYPNGTSRGGEIVITDTRERMFTVRVDFITGVVSIEEQTDE